MSDAIRDSEGPRLTDAERKAWGVDAQREIDRLRDELAAERKRGQEVYEYLCSTNPDNVHLSVMESVIQQRSIEHQLRAENERLRKENALLMEVGRQVKIYHENCECGMCKAITAARAAGVVI